MQEKQYMAKKKEPETDEIDLTIPDFLIRHRTGDDPNGEKIIPASTVSKQRRKDKDKVRSTKDDKGTKAGRKTRSKKV
tara:strand:+ start:2073 stop:2306 length:234 start_codon:yes stop_codon:yes gene_type:complete